MILLDVRMPIMDGFETAALIRKRQQSELTPIIFITAFGSDEIVTTDLYAQGAVDFIFAPVPPDELRAEGVGVREALPEGRGACAIRRARCSPRPSSCVCCNDELTAIARQDPLTGLGNRRAFEQDLDLLEARVAALRAPILHGRPRHRSLQVVQRHVRASGRRCRAADVRGRCMQEQVAWRRRALPLRRRRVPLRLSRTVVGDRRQGDRAHAGRGASAWPSPTPAIPRAS